MVIMNAVFVFFSSSSSLRGTDVELPGAEAADRAQCAAPDEPTGY